MERRFEDKLESILRHPAIYRASRVSPVPGLGGIATGYPELDTALPGGGWPRNALTELLVRDPGIGEVHLLVPALAALIREKRWISFVAPPHLPYAPALVKAGLELEKLLCVRPGNEADSFWAMLQALRSGVCGAVIGWLNNVSMQQSRALQLAAATGQCWAVLFRRNHIVRCSSAAVLRIRLHARSDGILLELMKCRGGRPGQVYLANILPGKYP